MKILAIDTATENCSAALLVDATLRCREELLSRGAAERILPMVQELLAEGGLALGDLDAIGFGRGPGGFTGVRLAASVTQGLSFAAGLKVVPVSNLRALAQRALGLPGAAPNVLVCSDARMQEVYWGCFARDAHGEAQLLDKEQVGPPDTVALYRGWRTASQVSAAGSGFAAYPQLGERLGPGVGAIHAQLLPRAAEIARLAVTEVRAGRVVVAQDALPVYLRNDVARPQAVRHVTGE